MSWSYTIARVRGIDVRVHATFLLVLVWAALYWGAVTGDGLEGALFGIVAILLLFACVVAHELGHSLMALHYGIDVEDITLLPIGGVARIEIPDDPKKEFWITAAGPAVNVVIVALLLILGAVLDAAVFQNVNELTDSMDGVDWSGLLPYLTIANIILIVFNILPAFPMDGGRVLRAMLASRMGYRQATEIAARVGQGMALIFGLLGFLSGNFFLIIIAIFIWFGAAAEGSQAAIRSVLGGLTVAQAMIRQPVTLAVDDPLTRAIELTLSTAQADFPVVDSGGQVLGMLTADDVLVALRDGKSGTAGSLMRRDVTPIAPTEALSEAQLRFAERKARALPVAEADGRLLGLLTINDLNEAFRLYSLQEESRRQPAMAAPR